MWIRGRQRTMCWTLAFLVGWPVAATLKQEPDDTSRVAAVQAFTERAERYVRLRTRLEEPLPAFDVRRDPWSLMLTRRYLASAIRTARVRAELGDIFAPPVTQLFRSVIAEAIHDVEIEGFADGEFEAADIVDLGVNEPVPAWALQAVPQPVLVRLPALPDAVAYVMVGRNLILWDAHAEIVIDVLPDAFVVE